MRLFHARRVGDEIQTIMNPNPERGPEWTNAVFRLAARETHLRGGRTAAPTIGISNDTRTSSLSNGTNVSRIWKLKNCLWVMT